MQKEIYEISSKYMKDLKKQLDNRKISPYDIAHKSFRKNNAAWIIKHVDKAKLKITYLNGDIRKEPTYSKLMKRISWCNGIYKSSRRKYIKRYYKIVNAFTKHRAQLKSNTLANCVKSFNIKQLT
jgi:hypothetical protein